MKNNFLNKAIKVIALSSVSLVAAFSCTNKDVSFCMNTTAKPDYLHMSAMCDDKNGIGIGFSGLVLHTEDGGATWTEAEKKSACLFAMDWITNKDVVAGGNKGGLVRTSDGGRNWERYPAIPVVRIKDVSFKSFENGWISSKSDIFETLDRGETWTKINNPNGVRLIESIYMVEKGHGFVCSSAGVLYETYDAGNTWQERAKLFDKDTGNFKIVQNHGMIQAAISFKDNVGYIECVGSGKNGYELKTFKSYDNGATWKETNTSKLEKQPVAVNICMNNSISITNSDTTSTIYKIN